MQGYNFFGQSPPSQAFSPSPQQLAAAMAMPDYTNATSPNAQPSSSNGMDLSKMAKMMQSLGSGVPLEAQAQGIPANAMSYNLSSGPLPWLPQNQLPWLSGGG